MTTQRPVPSLTIPADAALEGPPLGSGRRAFTRGLRMAGMTVAVAAISCGVVIPASASPVSVATTSANLIKDSGAESAVPDGGGGVVPVPRWKVPEGSQFTAVAYDTSGGFPTSDGPGPTNRGANFFAGGPTAAVSKATQSVSLSAYAEAIKDGKKKYKLSAWLGGYQSQADYATVTVSWRNSAKETITKTKLKTVTPEDRSNITGLLYRSKKGTVPEEAKTALITVTLTRMAGGYNDGYADKVRLVLS